MEKSAFDAHTIEKIKEKSALFQALSSEVAKVIVGQHDIITFIELADSRHLVILSTICLPAINKRQCQVSRNKLYAQ